MIHQFLSEADNSIRTPDHAPRASISLRCKYRLQQRALEDQRAQVEERLAALRREEEGERAARDRRRAADAIKEEAAAARRAELERLQEGAAAARRDAAAAAAAAERAAETAAREAAAAKAEADRELAAHAAALKEQQEAAQKARWAARAAEAAALLDDSDDDGGGDDDGEKTEKLQTLFEAIDANGSGAICLEEFNAVADPERHERSGTVGDAVKSLFALLDEDGNGTVDCGELVRALQHSDAARAPLFTFAFSEALADTATRAATGRDIRRNTHHKTIR